MSLLAKLLRRLALSNPRLEGLYRRLAHPGSREWAEMLRERGDFYAMGEYCAIDPHALIEGRHLIRIGNNVRIATCALFCHDGSVNMINRAYGLHLDNVGKIDIRDNVWIGYQAVILPGVTIGPNAIVSAGSVVRSDVAEGDVVSGVPAKRVGRLDMSMAMLKAKNQQFPWRHIIEKRAGEYDPALEPELIRLRREYFFGAEQEKTKVLSADCGGGAVPSTKPR
jgi:acetyltransferase-like isoleucine patch superfamily enzyme